MISMSKWSVENKLHEKHEKVARRDNIVVIKGFNVCWKLV